MSDYTQNPEYQRLMAQQGYSVSPAPYGGSNAGYNNAGADYAYDVPATPSGGVASGVRNAQFNNLDANRTTSQTSLYVTVYAGADKDNMRLLHTSPVFSSGGDPEAGNPYEYPSGSRQTASRDEVMSHRDAEVHALDYTEQWINANLGSQTFVDKRNKAKSAREVQVDLVVTAGTCNPCKPRLQLLADRVSRNFPNLISSRGTNHVSVKANYYKANNRVPVSGGRVNPQGVPQTAYGYPATDPNAELRYNASMVAQGYSQQEAQYISRRHRGGNPDVGTAAPTDRSRFQGPARTDSQSPVGSVTSSSGNSSGPESSARPAPAPAPPAWSASAAQSTTAQSTTASSTTASSTTASSSAVGASAGDGWSTVPSKSSGSRKQHKQGQRKGR